MASLTAVAQFPGTVVTVFESDFEVAEGDLISGGDLERKYVPKPTVLIDPTCTARYTDPPSRYSGTKGWARDPKLLRRSGCGEHAHLVRGSERSGLPI